MERRPTSLPSRGSTVNAVRTMGTVSFGSAGGLGSGSLRFTVLDSDSRRPVWPSAPVLRATGSGPAAVGSTSHHFLPLVGRLPDQGFQRQSQAYRRIARDQEEVRARSATGCSATPAVSPSSRFSGKT